MPEQHASSVRQAREIGRLRHRIAELEKILGGYEKLQSLVDREKIETDELLKAHESVEMLAGIEIDELRRTVTAHEHVEELARSEIDGLHRTIDAHQSVQKLAGDEIGDLERTIKAHEALQEYTRLELLRLAESGAAQGVEERLYHDELNEALLDSEKTIQAFERLQEFQRHQFMYYEKLVKAYENVSEMFSGELRQMQRIVKAHEAVEALARREMIELKERGEGADAGRKGRTVQQLLEELESAQKTVEALERLMDHQRETKINLDKTIVAYRSLSALSSSELDGAYRKIRVHEEIERLAWDEQREADADLMMAQKVQLGLIADSQPVTERFIVRHLYLPSTRLGGDFFGILPLADGRCCVMLCDAAGHGTQAALITMIMKTLFEEYAPRYRQPAALLNRLNARLYRIVSSLRTFVTGIVVILDPEQGVLRYANGGHPAGYLQHSDGRVVPLEKTGALLGVFDNIRYQTRTLRLEAGDRIFLCTDGAIECHGERDEEFGEERLLRLLALGADREPEAFLEMVRDALVTFRGSSRMEDDVSMILIRSADDGSDGVSSE